MKILSQKIIIDSLNDLLDDIRNNLKDESKTHIGNMQRERLFELHFSLGMYIRNRYVLSDSNVVPNLVSEYMQLIRKDNFGQIRNDRVEIDEWFDRLFYINDDAISGKIIELLWEQLSNKNEDVF